MEKQDNYTDFCGTSVTWRIFLKDWVFEHLPQIIGITFIICLVIFLYTLNIYFGGKDFFNLLK